MTVCGEIALRQRLVDVHIWIGLPQQSLGGFVVGEHAGGNGNIDGLALQLEQANRLPDELHGEAFCGQCMELARRQPRNFKVQIARLPAEREIAHAAADQPRPAAGAVYPLLDLTHLLREGRVLDAKTSRHLQRCLPQRLRRFFRRHRIDVEPRAPLEARHLGQLRNDFDVPVVKIPGLFVEGGTMENKVIGWLS